MLSSVAAPTLTAQGDERGRTRTMLIATEDLSAFHFSTQDVPPGARLAGYRDLFGRMLARFETTALDGALSCDARWRGFADISVLRIVSTPVRVTWSHLKNSASDDRLVLAMFRGRSGNVCQRGREADVAAGGAIVLSGTDPVRMVRADYTYFSLPRAALSPLVANANAAVMSVVPAGSETLALLSGYADLITGNVEAMSPAMCSLAETHVRDLIALTIGPRRDAAEVAKGRGLRAARLC